MVLILQVLVGVYVDHNVSKSKAIVLELGAVVKRELVWFPTHLLLEVGWGNERAFSAKLG